MTRTDAEIARMVDYHEMDAEMNVDNVISDVRTIISSMQASAKHLAEMLEYVEDIDGAHAPRLAGEVARELANLTSSAKLEILAINAAAAASSAAQARALRKITK